MHGGTRGHRYFIISMLGFLSTPVWCDTEQLVEITVTAQKRSQTAQDVPIAIAAFSAAQLESARIDMASDLSVYVPSLQYESFDGFAQPFLRGVGNDFSGPNADPSVATYIDGIYDANSQSVIDTLLGAERVEVLKGPQGTLYGRNATGGAINVITLTPTDESKGRLETGYGNYNRRDVAGYGSGALSSNLDGGIYFAYTNHDSYMHLAPGSNPPDTPQIDRNYGVRVKLVFKASDWLKLTGSAEYISFLSFDAMTVRQIDRNALGYAFGAPYLNQRYVMAADGQTGLSNTERDASLREEVSLGWAQLLGISAFRGFDGVASSDTDGTTLSVLKFLHAGHRVKQWSQELQLLSPSDSKVQWIAGIYVFDEMGGFYPSTKISNLLFPLLGLPPVAYDNSSVTTFSYAGFGQATVPLEMLSDSLAGFRLTAGLRWTRDEKHLYNSSTQTANFFGGPIVSTTSYPNHAASWSKFTPKVTLDYRIGGSLLYATFSEGYKAGVFNASSPAFPGPAAPETLTAYELGSKSDLTSQLRINTAAYYYKFKDLQVQVVVPGASGTVEFNNAGSAKAYGFEADMEAIVVKGLTLTAAMSYEHSEYTSFTNYAGFVANPTGGNRKARLDETGNPLQRAPKWVVSTGAHYERNLGDIGAISSDISWYFNDGFAWDPTGNRSVGAWQNAYKVINASVSFAPGNGKSKFTVWGKNLGNAFHGESYSRTPFGTEIQDAQPKTYGISASWQFGK